MKYKKEIHFTLHDYKTKSNENNKYMDLFLKIHKDLECKYYVETLRHLIDMYMMDKE